MRLIQFGDIDPDDRKVVLHQATRHLGDEPAIALVQLRHLYLSDEIVCGYTNLSPESWVVLRNGSRPDGAYQEYLKQAAYKVLHAISPVHGIAVRQGDLLGGQAYKVMPNLSPRCATVLASKHAAEFLGQAATLFNHLPVFLSDDDHQVSIQPVEQVREMIIFELSARNPG